MAVLSPAVAVIVVSPIAIPLITPFSSTVAISVSEEVHSTLTSGSSVSTLAVMVVSPSSSIFTELLFKLMDLIGKDTVIKQVALIEPAVAVMIAFPLPTAVTLPFSTVATLSSLDVQVMVLSSASSGAIVAVSVRTSSLASNEAVVLSSVMDDTPLGVTVTSHVAVLPLAVAVMVAVPTATAFTVPLFTVATEELELDQVTVLSVAFDGLTVAVRSAVPPFLIESVDWLKATPETSTTGSSFGPHAARRSVKVVRMSR